MKNTSIVLVFLHLLLSYNLSANMASPIIPGTMMATPFTSKYVDILSENIFIKINKGYSSNFTIKYRIKSSASGTQIPMIFYAIDYDKSFRIWIDGKEIQLQKLPDELEINKNTLFSDFENLFVKDSSTNNTEFEINQNLETDFRIHYNELIYFEMDLTEGEHEIVVKYDALPEIDQSDWVNQYVIKYSLTPAKYWKSFKHLDITIDATDASDKFTSNLSDDSSTQLDSIHSWSFNKLPVETIVIKNTPHIPSAAQFFLKLQPFGIALIISTLLVILHVVIIIKYRIKNISKRFSTPMIIGSIIIPFLFVSTNYFSYFFIDSLLTNASGYHGYIFLVFFLYPVILPFYFTAMWLTDRIYRRTKLKRG